MLDDILKLVKQEVLPAITNNAEVPSDKKDAVIETTTSTIVDGLKKQFTPDNLSAITNLFSGDTSEGSNIVSGLQSSVVNALSEKVGLNKDVANNIASAVIPAIIGLFSKKVNDPEDKGFNIESIIGALSGGKGSSGLLGMLGGLFGKK